MSKGLRAWKIDEAQLLPPSVRDYVGKGAPSQLIVALLSIGGLVGSQLAPTTLGGPFQPGAGFRPKTRSGTVFAPPFASDNK
jgi:hypothetical protein